MDAPTSPTSNDGPFLLPDHLRCTYRSKACPNERARKRNGTVHKLCQSHRVKANINQRNMQRRLRARRQLELAAGAPMMLPLELVTVDAAEAPSAMMTTFQDMLMDTEHKELAVCDLEPLCTPTELKPEDIEVLQLLWDHPEFSTVIADEASDVEMDMETETPTSELEPVPPILQPLGNSTSHHYTHCAVF